MNATAYIRISTDKQELSPEAQRAVITKYAEREGLAVASWHQDCASGSAPLEERPGLLAAIRSLEADSVLLVARRDRLARDVMLAGFIEKEVRRVGASIVSVAGEGNGDDPTAQLMRTIIDAFAQYERAMIRARTKSVLQSKIANGQRVGRYATFGYRLEMTGKTRVDKRKAGRQYMERVQVPDEGEQAAIRLILELAAKGWTVYRITRELADRGIVRWSGKPIRHPLVKTIIERHG